MNQPNVLLVPGLGNSGPLHWQSQWAEQYRYRRVELPDWDAPQCAAWLPALDAAVAAAPPGVVLVAHSLGCLAVAHWARRSPRPVGGALLVAPADVEQPDFPPEAQGFAPVPLRPLPFPSIVVASSNDEYVSLARAAEFARSWGSRLVEAGAMGHLNSASNLGRWPAGHALLRELLAQAAPRR